MGKVSLLIADDEESIRSGIAKFLQLHSDRFDPIYQAGDGEEAGALILQHHPDLMLLDIQMPLKNGVEVMEEAVEAGILPLTIVLSGFDEFRYAQKAIHFGARDYLLKPARSRDILEKLTTLADEISKEEEKPGGEEKGNTNALVRRAQRYIEENYYQDLSLDEVAEYVRITPGYLSTLFTQNLGIGFVEFLNQIRIEHACAYLEQGRFKTYEIAFKVGYNDEKYFSKVFHRITGQTPSAYKKSHIQ